MRPVEDSETREIEENTPEEGEIVMPKTSQMGSAGMWVHLNKNILKNGTTVMKTPEAPEGEEWDEDRTNEEMKKLLVSDPYAPLLASISGDKIAVGHGNQQAAWTCHIAGDATEYVDQSGKKVSNGVSVVRSLQWPGAYSFYYKSAFMQIYVGNGLKYEQGATFYPVEPPLIESDPKEYEGVDEPAQFPPKAPDEQVEEGGEGEQEEAEEDDE